MSIELTPTQQLELRRLHFEIENMEAAQLRTALMEIATQLFQKDQHYRSILKHSWGIGNCATPDNTPIPDNKVELENLRSYYNSGKMLMQGLTEDGMYDKMASALWAAQTNLIIASNPEMKGFTISYKDLPDEKKAELKVMVRFVIGVVIGTFPAMNMRNIQHQLEGSK